MHRQRTSTPTTRTRIFHTGNGRRPNHVHVGVIERANATTSLSKHARTADATAPRRRPTSLEPTEVQHRAGEDRDHRDR